MKLDFLAHEREPKYVARKKTIKVKSLGLPKTVRVRTVKNGDL